MPPTPRSDHVTTMLLTWLTEGLTQWFSGPLIATAIIGSTIGPDLCEALIGYQAFSGCDSISAFVGHGKAKGHKLLHDHLLKYHGQT